MSPAEVEEAVKGLNREELPKLASYIPALHATRADPMMVRCDAHPALIQLLRSAPNEI